MSIFEKYTKAWNESGDREALMLIHQLKDGLMWRTESGATPLLTKG